MISFYCYLGVEQAASSDLLGHHHLEHFHSDG